MIYEMKLTNKYYNYILDGTKRIELRLYDEKRRKIKIGDKIKFINKDNLNKYFYVKVIGILRYDTFDDLFNDFDISILASNNISKDELKIDLEKFYSKEKQEKYGVVGLRFILN